MYDALSKLDEIAFKGFDEGLTWVTGFSDAANGWFGAHLNEVEMTHMPTTREEIAQLARARERVIMVFVGAGSATLAAVIEDLRAGRIRREKKD